MVENNQSIVPVEDMMEALQVTRKVGMMNTFESLCTYNKVMLNIQMNGQCTLKPNAVFDAIIQNNTGEGNSLL